MSIGERIKLVRKELGITQDDIAAKIGVSKSSISLIESGTNNPSERTIRLLCQQFRVSEVWLKEGIGEMFIRESANEAMMRIMYGQDEVFKAIFLSLADAPPEHIEAFRQFALNLKRHLDELPPNEKGGP